MKGKAHLILALQRIARAEKDGVRDRIAERQVLFVIKINS